VIWLGTSILVNSVMGCIIAANVADVDPKVAEEA